MNNKLHKYAKLLLEKGLSIKKGMPLLVNAPVEAIELVRIITEEACRRGVNDIYFDFTDDVLKHLELSYYDKDSIVKSNFWNKTIYNEYAKKGSAFLFLIDTSNEDMDDVSKDNLEIASRHSLETRDYYFKLQENNRVSWCIAPVATKEWANIVFNNKENDINKLWNIIFDICLINEENPIKEWDKRVEENHLICQKLTNLNIKELHYTNSLGTDLTITLPNKVKWLGGSSIINGEELLVNIPSEEVFTTPNKYLTSGVVYTKIPLVHQGIVINDIYLKFTDGRVTDFSSSSGYDELKNIIYTDNESSMLGEVALVSATSKIAQTNLLFYETLFDENASCHIALGRGFKECYSLSEIDYEKVGYNQSKNHVDIMIGTSDMHIEALTYDNKKITIFEKGNFK